jgi:hypothetical protein
LGIEVLGYYEQTHRKYPTIEEFSEEIVCYLEYNFETFRRIEVADYNSASQ